MTTLDHADLSVLEPVAICIATIGRPSLAALIDSLRSELPGPVETEVFVIDNTPDGRVKALVDDLAAGLPVPMRYVSEREPGISAARNAAVRAAAASAAVIFVDDDEAVTPGWLEYMLNAAVHWESDVVLGHVAPLFERGVPRWATRSSAFGLPNYGPPGTMLATAATGNTLVRRSVLDAFPEPFDARYGLTGGGDAHFFQRVAQAGFRIVAEPRALAYERIGRNRASLGGMVRRAYRNGLVDAQLRADFRHMSRSRLFIRACRNVVAGTLTAMRAAVDRDGGLAADGLFRSGVGAGMFVGLLGRTNSYYHRERRDARG